MDKKRILKKNKKYNKWLLELKQRVGNIDYSDDYWPRQVYFRNVIRILPLKKTIKGVQYD